jgi:molecular chaperone HtpG
MENSTVATNEKVNKHIPNDLAFSIISKLSVKSLKRFGCVCKSWTILFENPHFMNIYRNNFITKNISYCDDTFLLLQEIISPFSREEHSVMHLLYGERFENNVKIDLPPPFYEDGCDIRIFGSVSVNGIFCLSQRNNKFVLWNPTTKEFKVIPPSPIEYVPPYSDRFWDLHGFGYDHVRDDYKLIRQVVFYPLTESIYDSLGVERPLIWDKNAPLWEIYNLRSNSWKKLDVKLPYHIQKIACPRLYMDGMSHWYGANEETMTTESLVSFDWINEVFFTTPIPSYCKNRNPYFELVHLIMLNGSVAFISSYVESTVFHISILGELGVKESWTNLFTVDILPSIERPIEPEKKNIIFFERKREGAGLSWFNLNAQIIEEFTVKGQRVRHEVAIYKRNLLHTRGLND